MEEVQIPHPQTVDAPFLKPFDPPCDQVQRISYFVNSMENPAPPPQENGNGVIDHIKKHSQRNVTNDLQIIVFFKFIDYEEIVHVPAFDFESLVGNLGGNVGMFIGFAFWHLPDIIYETFLSCKAFTRKLGQ